MKRASKRGNTSSNANGLVLIREGQAVTTDCAILTDQELSSLVVMKNGQLMTSTLAMAEDSEHSHATVLQLIKTYQTDLEEFGKVRFVIQPFETPGGMQRRRIAVLNEPQAMLIMSYMRRNETVRAFKKRLIKAFHNFHITRS